MELLYPGTCAPHIWLQKPLNKQISIFKRYFWLDIHAGVRKIWSHTARLGVNFYYNYYFKNTFFNICFSVKFIEICTVYMLQVHHLYMYMYMATPSVHVQVHRLYMSSADQLDSTLEVYKLPLNFFLKNQYLITSKLFNVH